MKIRQHDFTGGKGCIHCGTKSPETTCNEREVPDPVPGLRVPAVEDYDAIGRRMAEIRGEIPPPPPAAPPTG